MLKNLLLLGSCAGQQAAQATNGEAPKSNWWLIVIYIVVFVALLYFVMIRPQRKQKKEQEARMSSIDPGDSILTTSGFYGTIVAINGDTVIVEFGNNKNCRIPMSREAIAQVEKANAQVAQAAPQSEKKFFGRKKAAKAEEAQAATETTTPVENAAPAPAETPAEAPAETPKE